MTSSMELGSLAAHQSVDWRREGMRRVVCCVRTGVWRRLGGGMRHLVAGVLRRRMQARGDRGLAEHGEEGEKHKEVRELTVSA